MSTVLPRRLHIRTKVAAALTAPLLAAFAMAVLKAAEVRSAAERVTDESSMATSIVGPGTLLTALQVERNVVAFDLIGLDAAIVGTTGQDPDGAIEATDERLTEFEELVSSRDEDVEAVYTPALAALDTLGEIRAEALRFEGPRGFANVEFAKAIFGRYTAVVEGIVGANSRLALSLEVDELRYGADLIDLSNRQEDLVARIVAEVIFATFGHGGLEQRDDIAAVSALLGGMRSNDASLRASARGDYAEPAEAYLTADHIVRFPELVDEAIATGSPVLIDPVGGEGILDKANVQGDDLDGGHTHISFQEEAASKLLSRADHLNDDARRTELAYLGFGSLGLLTAASITFVVSRSITRPLRSLTRQAKHMAEHRLPDAVQNILETPMGKDVAVPYVDPIAVTTRDEVSDVARALNSVQDSALDLAVEQAVLRRNIADSFVNLGRRNQNLLGRQLDFITELESNATDPDTLADLFRLDHLATRMRRNAESLLVLAGIEPPRQWAAPVRLADVIRAALGEVEDYQRVAVRGVEPATIVGTAAADLAHLLAELIENALVFSPPDQTVDIHGRHRPARAAANAGDLTGYTLAIVDSGLGMPPTEVTAANRRLAGAESFTIAPSKYLGHYVAGNLAARHGIEIQLHGRVGHNDTALGTTVTVGVPPSLLTDHTHGHADDITHLPPRSRQLRHAAPLRAPSGEATAASPGPASQLRIMGGSKALADAPHARALPSEPRGGSQSPPERLTRRVSGAQIPRTEPLSVRRAPDPGAPDPAGSRGRSPAVPLVPSGIGEHQARTGAATSQRARDVYDFLSNFTRGVQLGLDEARTRSNGEDDQRRRSDRGGT